MNQIASGRLAGTIFIICISVYFSFRSYQHRSDAAGPVFLSILLVALLDIPPTFLSFLEALKIDIPKWSNIVGYGMLLLGALLGTFAVEQFLNDKVYSKSDVLLSRRSLLIGPPILAMMILMCLTPGATSFTDGVSFEASWSFLLSYSIYYLVLIVTHIMIGKAFVEDLLKHRDDIGYIIRRIIGLSGIITVLLAVIAAEINLMVLYAHSKHAETINWFVQDLGRGLALLFLLLSFAVPEVIFLRVTQPLIDYIELKRYNILYQLCCVMASLVQENAPMKDHNLWRLMIDISKFREWILSHRYSEEPLKAYDEAAYICQLLLEGRTFTTPGIYKPAVFPYTYPDLLAHNLVVAKKLSRSLRNYDYTHIL